VADFKVSLKISVKADLFTCGLLNDAATVLKKYTANPRITRLIRSEKLSRNTKTRKVNNWLFFLQCYSFSLFLTLLQPFLSQLGLLLFPIPLKMNELRSTSTGLANSTLPLTLLLVRCDQLVRAPHSHATTVHGDCKITVQFSHGFFFP
jgi:hypothetical protein